jgi:hypothetical protein
MKKLLFLFFIFSLLKLNIYAQKSGITAMHKFMQLNSDTTVILEFKTNWLGIGPEYYLLSKKDDTISCYTYKELRKPIRALIPEKISWAIFKYNTNNIASVAVDINIHFNPFEIKRDSVLKFWKDVTALNPFLIKDDLIDGDGCPPIKNKDGSTHNSIVYDGGEVKIYLITKDKIKELNFYAPDFYEKICPGREGRVAILKMVKLFKDKFRF